MFFTPSSAVRSTWCSISLFTEWNFTQTEWKWFHSCVRVTFSLVYIKRVGFCINQPRSICTGVSRRVRKGVPAPRGSGAKTVKSILFWAIFLSNFIIQHPGSMESCRHLWFGACICDQQTTCTRRQQYVAAEMIKLVTQILWLFLLLLILTIFCMSICKGVLLT